MHNALGGLVASARPGRLPGEVKAGLAFRSPPLTFDRRDLAAQKETVARRFADVGWQTPRLLDAMHRSTDFHLDSLGKVHLDSWTRGRVALVGDAGYSSSPLTGLGTSLALVGAYVLAGELAAAPGDIASAFRGFAPNSALAIRFRAMSMRSMNRWPMRQLLAAQFAKAGDIDLPEYGLPVAR
ncbi:hypothetical protein [Kitasatospora sp. NPDC004289]